MESLPRVSIIGMGEVGTRLATALQTAGTEVVPVTRSSGWQALADESITADIVCVREESLAEVLERRTGLPSRHLVLVQNGWIRDRVAQQPQLTRGLIWFMSKGDFFRELRPSPWCGPLAIPMARSLARGGLTTVAVSPPDFAGLDAEKMGFNCVVGLPLAVSGLSLGEYLRSHADEAHAVFDEAVTACAAAVAQAPSPRWWDDFLEFTTPLSWVKSSRAKALAYRNGAVVELGASCGVPTPVNRRLLAAHAELG